MLNGFRNIVRNSINCNKAIGLECLILDDDSLQFKICYLQKIKNEVVVLKTIDATNLTDLNTIPEFQETPFCISLSGKGILHKRIHFDKGDKHEEILSKILSNAKASDFFLQSHQAETLDDHSAYVSVIRNDLLAKILSLFADIAIVNFQLGPFSVKSVIPLLRSKADELFIGPHSFIIGDTTIKDYHYSYKNVSEKIYLIEDDNVSAEFLVAYSMAFERLIFVHPENELPIKVITIKNDFKQKRIFKSLGITFLSFFFFALLLNFLLLEYYSSKNSSLSQQELTYKSSQSEFENLKEQFDAQQQFISKNGLLLSVPTSYYADRLTFDLPTSILLDKLNIFPVSKKNNDEKSPLVSDKSKIVLGGITTESNELSKWMELIKKKSFIKEVNVLEYVQNAADPGGHFILEIVINNKY